MVPFLTSQLLSFSPALLITTFTHSANTSPRHFLGEAGFSALGTSLGVGPEISSLPLLKTTLTSFLFYYDWFELTSAELLSSWACTALSEGG